MSDWANAALIDRVANDQGIDTSRRYLSVMVIALLCALILPLSNISPFSVTSAQAETRTLKLYFTHTRESATITYKKNGRYLKGGLKKLNRFLRDWRRNEPTRMDPKLFDLVWEVYKRTGSRKRIHVISGYRSPKTNAALRRRGRKVASKSQHMKGRALDFFLPDVSVDKLRALGLKAHVGGVGYYRGSFVHLDTGSVRHWPRMSRSQLARVFPRGRTLHVPTDGKRMAGYQYALAKYKRRKRTGGPVLVASASTSKPKKKSGTLLARVFSGGALDREDQIANSTVARKKPNKEKAVASASASKKSRKNDALPGVTVANAPKVEPAPEEENQAEPGLPDHVIVPTSRPSTEAETLLASASGTIEPDKAATIVASRFDPSDTPLPILRASLKIEETRFALAATPELTATQRAAEALSRVPVKPVAKPEIIAASENLPKDTSDKFSESVEVALLETPRSLSVPANEPSLSQQALGVTKPTIEASPAPAAPIAVAPLKTPAVAPKVVAKPEQAKETTRIGQAFDALSTHDIVVASLPTSKPATTSGNTTPKARPIDLSGAVRNIPLPQKSDRHRSSQNIKARSRKKPSNTPVLKLGNLNGEEVASWALSSSTRVGRLAKLTAPRYLGILTNTPSTIVDGGFGAQLGFNRTNRFSGQAIKRLAFATFITSDAPEGHVFLTDRY